MKRRKSSVHSNPVEISSKSSASDTPGVPEAQLSSQEKPSMLPPPIPEPRSRPLSLVSPPIPEPRSRPLSLVSKKNNRLSISFPIQPSETMSTGRQTPTQSSAFPSPIAPNQSVSPSPPDSAGFMVALAAQERKVFELREELSRAEVELKKLKAHWAMHEADKKRAEIKLVQKLEPIQLVETSQNKTIGMDDEDIARRSAELDRRKAILAANGTKVARRKIITGGHTRALSLLSPERSPHSQILNFDSVEGKKDSFDIRPGIHRKMTMPDTSQGLSRVSSDRARHSYQGSTAIGVKQIAEDLKAGLWTFMEDLRQATVGEEALQRSPIGVDANRASDGPGTAPSSGSVKRADQNKIRSPTTRGLVNLDRAETSKSVPVSKAKNAYSPSQPLAAHPSTPPLANAMSTPTSNVDDDWSNWDSPSSKGASPRWSNSTMPSSDDASEAGKSCAVASELKTDIVANPSPLREDESPWAAFHSFTPVNLKRTASNFIKEFEKSLTPPPESPNSHHDNSDTPLFSKDKTISDNEARLLLNNLP